MKDGLYLSAFLVDGELPCAMDIKLRHDQTIALWEKRGSNVELLRYWELERFSGWKQHTFTFLSKEEIYKVIDYLLSTIGIKREDIIEIWGTPSIDKGENYICEELYGGVCYHNICHLFSSYLLEHNDLNEDMLILALDSGPESIAQPDAYHKLYYSGAYVHNHRLIVFPIQSPGKLWSNSKKRFNMREGSLMALASASKARINEKYSKKVELRDEYALQNALDYLNGLAEHIVRVGYSTDSDFSDEENYISAFIKQVNEKSQEILVSEIDKAIRIYKIDCEKTVLGLAGGFTLNCPTNTFIMDKYHFKRLQIPPCANDSGEALGIGLATFYLRMNELPNFDLKTAFVGADVNDFISDNVYTALRYYSKEIISVEDYSPIQAANDIKNGVVAWVQGRAEIGPRSLGHRSILGNPMLMSTKKALNKIKQRQWWRPVAPIVLENKCGDIFLQNRKSPYMLEAFQVKQEWKARIPAVVHLDGTARVQTLTEKDNELLYTTIRQFEATTGVPVICNTSLNDKGEPIIQTAKQAIDFCLAKGIDIIYIDGKRIKLKTCYDNKTNYITREFDRNPRVFHHLSEEKINEINQKCNPHGLDRETLTYYYDNPEIVEKYDIRIENECKKVIELKKAFQVKNGISLKRDIL